MKCSDNNNKRVITTDNGWYTVLLCNWVDQCGIGIDIMIVTKFQWMAILVYSCIDMIMVNVVLAMYCVWNSIAWTIIICWKASSGCQTKVHQHSPANQWCKPTGNNYNGVHRVNIFSFDGCQWPCFLPCFSSQLYHWKTVQCIHPLKCTTSLWAAGLRT